jgi:ubiquinone biosynthesis monooxygenase Coq6
MTFFSTVFYKMGEGYASIVWSTKPHLAKMLKSVSEADFVDMVNAAFRLSHVDMTYFYNQFVTEGEFPSLASEVAWRDDVMVRSTKHPLPPKVVAVQEHSRASFPLRLRNSERYISDRVALIG